MELECRLKEFHIKLHAEWWTSMGLQDRFLGKHIFLNHSHIKHLCHLVDSGLLTTIDNLCNNFKWNWMDDHGVELLGIIHDVYGHSLLGVVDTMSSTARDSEPTPSDPSTVPVPTNPSPTSKALLKPQAKKGQGSQRCSACHLLGHNSTFTILFQLSIDFIYTT